MVDSQAINPSFGIKPKDSRVNGLEHLVILDADRRQVIDLEKTPPVDSVIARTPPCEAIMLRFQQAMELLAS